MPWSIRKRGSEYCVVKDGDGEVEGCHSSRKKAQSQLAALNITENSTEGPWKRAKNTMKAARLAHGHFVLDFEGDEMEDPETIVHIHEYETLVHAHPGLSPGFGVDIEELEDVPEYTGHTEEPHQNDPRPS